MLEVSGKASRVPTDEVPKVYTWGEMEPSRNGQNKNSVVHSPLDGCELVSSVTKEVLLHLRTWLGNYFCCSCGIKNRLFNLSTP